MPRQEEPVVKVILSSSPLSEISLSPLSSPSSLSHPPSSPSHSLTLLLLPHTHSIHTLLLLPHTDSPSFFSLTLTQFTPSFFSLTLTQFTPFLLLPHIHSILTLSPPHTHSFSCVSSLTLSSLTHHFRQSGWVVAQGQDEARHVGVATRARDRGTRAQCVWGSKEDKLPSISECLNTASTTSQ